MSLRLSGTILGCGRSAGAVIPALGSGRYSPGPNIGLPSWRKGSALNFTTNVVWGQPGALATVSNILTNGDTSLRCRLPLNIGRSFRVSTLEAVTACCGRSSREDRGQRRTYPYDGWGKPAKEAR